ncbi:glycosyltransferase [Actinomycetospora rhizophila]|uniref:Glycosyltransferase n=1 Tax=Actinomycetospora rhizophila TaxID=1416876 RepID=A0ABV9ZNL0_9PSEU
MTAPHPALPGRSGGLGPAEVVAGVGRTELVDAVDEGVVAEVAARVTEASDALLDYERHGAAGPAGAEPRELRHPVDLEVVIPAYNESGRLPATLAAMVAFLSEQPWTSRVVVVDNGSVDDTAASVLAVDGRACNVATGWCVEVVAIGCSRAGKGAAVYRGLRTSRSRFVGFTDADLSTPLETFRPVMDALEGGAAAAIGSRHAPGAQIATRQPLGRRLGGAAFRAVSRPLLPGVRDTQCGFKFFDRAAVQSALWRSRSVGFAFDVELLRHVRDDGGRIVEIPVTWTDAAGSSLRPVRDGLAAFSAVARLHAQLGGGRPERPLHEAVDELAATRTPARTTSAAFRAAAGSPA